MVERAAANMAFQGVLKQDGVIPTKVAELQGSDCIGTLVNAPLSMHKDGVRILPMETVLENKGTGVVANVPYAIFLIRSFLWPLITVLTD